MIQNNSHTDPAQADAPMTEGVVLQRASFYDLTTNLMTFGQIKRLRSLTVKLAELKPGESLLDVGCGTGGVTIPAKLRLGPSGNAAGIDPSPDMITAAKKKARRQELDIDFRVGVIEALPFPDATFDAVTASLMMHHLPKPLQAKGLAEIFRVLKPGGRLLIADMIIPRAPTALGSILSMILHHRGRQIEAAELLDLLKGAGFGEAIQLEPRFLVIGFVRAVKVV